MLNDAALARGWAQGFPKKLGSIFQTRTYAAPSPAASPVKPGARFGASLSARRLSDVTPDDLRTSDRPFFNPC